jgi:hypothetical protein
MLVIKDNEVLELKIFDDGRKEYTKGFPSTRILLPNKNVKINTIINIPIAYQVFNLEAEEYITDTSVNKEIEVYVNDNLVGTETILNGVGSIEFESAEAGVFVIRVEDYSCEVTVNA